MLLGSQAVGRDGHLWVGGCNSVALAREYGTPLQVIDEDGLRETCRSWVGAFERFWPRSEVAYACKAFATGELLRVIVGEGLGVEVVSEGELALALYAGVPPQRVTVHGSYKSERQIAHAVEHRVGRIVIDSLGEARRIAAAARGLGVRQTVLVRLNPAVHVKDDTRYSTGEADSKFGLSLGDGSAARAIEECLAETALDLEGVHFHLGSQLQARRPYRDAIRAVAAFLGGLTLAWRARRVILGGGMAARYTPDDAPPTPTMWAGMLIADFKTWLLPRCDPAATVAIEPGRAIVAENGLTLYTIGPIKPAAGISKPIEAFVSVDGGLSDNPKPVMSGTHHEALLAGAADAPEQMTVEICGHHCGTDTLVPVAALPHMRPGDVLALQSTGAYTFCMASNYNRFPRPAVVCAGSGRARLVLRRETLEELLRTELTRTARPADGGTMGAAA